MEMSAPSRVIMACEFATTCSCIFLTIDSLNCPRSLSGSFPHWHERCSRHFIRLAHLERRQPSSEYSRCLSGITFFGFCADMIQQSSHLLFVVYELLLIVKFSTHW